MLREIAPPARSLCSTSSRCIPRLKGAPIHRLERSRVDLPQSRRWHRARSSNRSPALTKHVHPLISAPPMRPHPRSKWSGKLRPTTTWQSGLGPTSVTRFSSGPPDPQQGPDQENQVTGSGIRWPFFRLPHSQVARTSPCMKIGEVLKPS